MNPLVYVEIFSCYTILLFQCLNDITVGFKISTASSVTLMTRKDKEDKKKSLDKSCNHRGLEKFLNDSVILQIFFFLGQRSLRAAGGRGELTAAREAPSVGRQRGVRRGQLWEQKPAKNTRTPQRVTTRPSWYAHTHTDTHSTVWFGPWDHTDTALCTVSCHGFASDALFLLSSLPFNARVFDDAAAINLGVKTRVKTTQTRRSNSGSRSGGPCLRACSPRSHQPI